MVVLQGPPEEGGFCYRVNPADDMGRLLVNLGLATSCEAEALGDLGSPLAVELAPGCVVALERVIASGAIVGPRLCESPQRLPD